MSKKKIHKVWIVALVVIFAAFTLIGCEQAITKSLGGDMTMDLAPGEKLETITWKEDDLWYLTRPMREGEKAETHVFKQSSVTGIFEGTVTIVEHEEEQNE